MQLRNRPEEFGDVRGVLGADVFQHSRRKLGAVTLAGSHTQGSASSNSLGDLLFETLGGGERTHRAELGALLHGVAHGDGPHRGAELLGEFFVERVDDDETLGAVAGLAIVVDAGGNGSLNGGIHVIGRHEDERVRAAQFENALLEVGPGRSTDDCAGAFGTRKGDSLDARVIDHCSDLVVVGEHILVAADWQTGFVNERFERRRRLGALLRRLHQNGVAENDAGAGETSDLVDRKVPRHDAEDGSDGALANPSGASSGRNLLIGKELFCVVGEVAENVSRELNFAHCLCQRLSHFAHNNLAEFVGAFSEQIGNASHDRCALFYLITVHSAVVFGVRCGDYLLNDFVTRSRVRLTLFAGVGIDHLKSLHERFLAARKGPATPPRIVRRLHAKT